jgi:hypothetical protein
MKRIFLSFLERCFIKKEVLLLSFFGVIFSFSQEKSTECSNQKFSFVYFDTSNVRKDTLERFYALSLCQDPSCALCKKSIKEEYSYCGVDLWSKKGFVELPEEAGSEDLLNLSATDSNGSQDKLTEHFAYLYGSLSVSCGCLLTVFDYDDEIFDSCKKSLLECILSQAVDQEKRHSIESFLTKEKLLFVGILVSGSLLLMAHKKYKEAKSERLREHLRHSLPFISSLKEESNEERVVLYKK